MAFLLLAGPAAARKFYDDDPIQTAPPPLPVAKLPKWEAHAVYDFVFQSFRPKPRRHVPAQAVNTLGEVPDSEWFTNRQGRRTMTREELQRGPGGGNPPLAPFVVVGAKSVGITRGFRVHDASGRLFFVKPDPLTNPEMATAAEMIGSRFFYAIGYNTPDNYLLYLRRDQIRVSPKASVEVAGGKRRRMIERDLDDILIPSPRREDGTWRLIASLNLPGQVIGHFRYDGTRTDDPNDVVPHQHRRDLRGLAVFCAWLNHTDAKGGNSADTLVEQNGNRFVRHYLIDFGSILGSDGDMPKNARFSHEFVIPDRRRILERMLLLGLDVRRWESARYGRHTAVGRLESQIFDLDRWKPNYPNPAFLHRLPDDEYWAAKIVMAFRDGDIRTLVEMGHYSDPESVNFLTARLIERRDKIGRAAFTKILALDRFRIEDGALRFDDLAVQYGFVRDRRYAIAWARFDNETGQTTLLPAENSVRLPADIRNGATLGDRYYAASIHATNDPEKTVVVYLQAAKGAHAARVVGLDRHWSEISPNAASMAAKSSSGIR